MMADTDPTAQWVRMSQNRKIAIALDQSEESAYALQYSLQNIIRPSIDELLLLHVHDPSPYIVQAFDTEYGLEVASDTLDVLRAQAREKGKAMLQKHVDMAAQAQVSCSGSFLTGDAKDKLVTTAEKEKVDLIIVGSRGLGALSRAFLGSVSDYVLHHSHCPVLIVKIPPPFPNKDMPREGRKRTVVVAVDQSDGAKYAFRWALHEYLRPETDRAVLLYVQSTPSFSLDYTISLQHRDEMAALEAREFRAHEAFLEDLVKQAAVLKIECGKDVVRGDARMEIVKELENLQADTLVIGSRGLGMVKRMFVGSVSDYCAHVAPCPVLVVKPPPPKDDDRGNVPAEAGAEHLSSIE